MITHIVFMQFKSEDKEANIDRARDQLLGMVGKVDALRHLEVGLNLSESPRACDLALVTKFDDADGLAEYAQDPVHVEVKNFLQRVTEHTYVVDYESVD